VAPDRASQAAVGRDAAHRVGSGLIQPSERTGWAGKHFHGVAVTYAQVWANSCGTHRSMTEGAPRNPRRGAPRRRRTEPGTLTGGSNRRRGGCHHRHAPLDRHLADPVQTYHPDEHGGPHLPG
jgi:hypothetical protein